MAQNIYDDDEFFEAYSRLPRSVNGLDGAPEWPTLVEMLPDLDGTHVADLGCGYGWFARWAMSAGAASVLGIDLSEKMLTHAASRTSDDEIVYQRQDLEHLELHTDHFDVVYSSLTLHYIVDLDGLFREVHGSLRPGGGLVFSVEHPLFTAPSNPSFVDLPDGPRVWPVDHYLLEGPRTTDWLAPGVVKQHRTIATYVTLLRRSGFELTAMVEWGPSDAQIAEHPSWTVERDRPPFLLVSARRD